jgi:hypothetical protein
MQIVRTERADDVQSGRFSLRYSQYLLLLILIVIGSVRVISTYRVFSQTYDEPAHIACGLEWLELGTYTCEVQHPPLARVAAAAGMYLRGAHYDGRFSEVWQRGNPILAYRDQDVENLAISRAGVLPFFWLASLGVFFWCRTLAGPATALLAVLLFTNLPPVLAHAGLATTDMAVTATFTWALFAFNWWLESPRVLASLAFGFAAGMMLLSKFSSVLFFPVAAFVIVVLAWIGKPGFAIPLRKWVRPLCITFAALFLTVWAGYRFSVSRVSEGESAQKLLINSPSHSWFRLAADVPLPAGKVVRGIGAVLLHARKGHEGFLLGELRSNGWWYFFPVVMAVKTPLGFLILLLFGFGFAITTFRRAREWRLLALCVVVLAVLASCFPSSINLGVRHILPIYPIMAIIAAMAAAHLFARPWSAAIAVTLIAWVLVSSALAHPDYLAYFNEMGGRHPENILVDSDLDWGQDLRRLATECRARGIDALEIAYFGTADLSRAGLPRYTVFEPGNRPNGCFAVSLSTLEHAPQIFLFLNGRPYRLIGRSIRLYCG